MNRSDLLLRSAETLQKVRDQSPLVHNITNYVVMNLTANVLLAAGASPVMIHAPEELKDISRLSSALVVNIGTLSGPWLESMLIACEYAAENGTPVVIDPVGAGATAFRTASVQHLLATAGPCTVRGNASEICALAGESSTTKGVDSVLSSEQALDAVRVMAEKNGSSVVVSGATDFILHEGRIYECRNGHPLMTKVTGLGCSATALLGAFIGACGRTAEALTGATLTMSIAGEIAAERATGTGSFAVAFLDALSEMTPGTILERAKFSL